MTSENFAGEGTANCEWQDDCDDLDEDIPIWSPTAGKESPNTTVAIINLSAVYTKQSDNLNSLQSDDVLRALNKTLTRMALPKRLQLRVVPVNNIALSDLSPETPVADDDDDTHATAYAAKDCSQSLPFKAYLVGDSQTMINRAVKGLKTKEAGEY